MFEHTDRGGFVAIMRQHQRQIDAVENHTTAEGYAVETAVVLDSYDRALHPWIHGRRPYDLVARLKEVI